ncbi:MAG TPA: hypothetical protein GXX71_00440 [Acholeplasma sp.]|jgi:hypothetical protein|nr:hypothetical protein [Acholeplasma sp.]
MKKYKICDLIVKMNPIYEPLKSQIIPYLVETDEEIDFEIPNIEDKVEKLFNETQLPNIGTAEYLLYGSYFYTRLIMYEGVMLHSSSVVYEDKAYLFSAPSGTGKSTHTSLWLEVFEGSYILNDDKPAIRIIDDKIYAYGTPFSGKTDLSVPTRKEIKGICFLERSKENWIKEASLKDAISFFYRETVRPGHKELLDRAFDIVEKIVENVKIYRLGVNISHEAAILAYNKMNEAT